MRVAFYDTKPYDRQYFQEAEGSGRFEFVFHDFHLNETTAALADGCDAVCIFVNDHADQKTLEVLSRGGVKMVALRCSGFNNVDLEAAKKLGLTVARVPAYSPNAVAEYTLGLLLTLNRKIHRAYNRVRDRNFSLTGMVGFDIQGKTVGVVGTGKIGRMVAKVFHGLEARVLAFDKYADQDWAQTLGVEYVDMETLLAESHIVTLHTPLMMETYHMLNKLTFSKMKRGAYLINTSRGALVNTAALIEALKSGHLGGVGLDVYEEEEGVFFEDLSEQVLQDDDLALLLSFPNVLITSHQAFLTQEALKAIARVTLNNLSTLVTGDPVAKENLL